MKIINTIY